MILQIGDWKFDIDMTRTFEYSAKEAAEHCDCAYCRNFYAAVDGEYPSLRPFLAQFGLNIEAPEEQMPYDLDGKMYYDSTFLVFGEILQAGEKEILEGDVSIRPVFWDDSRFALDIGTVVLPWVLEEPLEDTVSPANLPSFLQKMWQKLLDRMPDHRTQS